MAAASALSAADLGTWTPCVRTTPLASSLPSSPPPPLDAAGTFPLPGMCQIWLTIQIFLHGISDLWLDIFYVIALYLSDMLVHSDIILIVSPGIIVW